MLDPSPRQTSLLVRFAIVAVTLLAMVKFLPRATGAERPADDAVFRHTVEPSRETGFAPRGKQSCGGACAEREDFQPLPNLPAGFTPSGAKPVPRRADLGGFNRDEIAPPEGRTEVPPECILIGVEFPGMA